MINIKEFIEKLKEGNIRFFTGVPDSNLNDFCKAINLGEAEDRHVIASNEGNAIAIAAGHYLAQGDIPLVYMQNSGMGNALNPLVSLTDRDVYSVPMVLMIGWRGDPDIKDHAQHKRQGLITTTLLEDMDIPYFIVNEENAMEAAEWAAAETVKRSAPVALIAKKGVFAVSEKVPIDDDSYPLSREEAIGVVIDTMPDAICSATTGRAARELFELRNRRGQNHEKDFLNVGSMGHASSVAFGIAKAKPERQVICLDGDAACIMHMGSLAIEGQSECSNYIRVVLNNGVHESVGGQPSVGWKINLTEIAKECGFRTVDFEVNDEETLVKALKELSQAGKGPGFIDMRIHAGLSPDMPPLKYDHKEVINSLKEELNR